MKKKPPSIIEMIKILKKNDGGDVAPQPQQQSPSPSLNINYNLKKGGAAKFAQGGSGKIRHQEMTQAGQQIAPRSKMKHFMKHSHD